MPATMSLQGLLLYDSTLLDSYKLPDGLDRKTVNAAVLMECQPFELLIPQPVLFKSMLELFALRRLPVWQNLYNTTVQQYDMLDEESITTSDVGSSDNKRTPDLERVRTPDLTDTRTPDLTTDGQNRGSDSVEQGVAAFNSSAYENRERQVTTLGTGNVVHSTGNETTTRRGTETETERGSEAEHGEHNNTITTRGRRRPAAELLEMERQAAMFDVVQFIAEDIKHNFCICVY